MEEKLKELLSHIESNAKHLYKQDISKETLIQGLLDKGYKYVTKPNDQSIVDVCTVALVLYLRCGHEKNSLGN